MKPPRTLSRQFGPFKLRYLARRSNSNPIVPAPNPGEPDIQQWRPDNDPAILPGSIPMPGDALPLTIPPSTPATAPAPAPLPIPAAAPATPIAPIAPVAAVVPASPVMAGTTPSIPAEVVTAIPGAAKPVYQPNTAPGKIVPASAPGGDPCKSSSSDLCQGQISDVVKGNSDKIEKLDLGLTYRTKLL